MPRSKLSESNRDHHEGVEVPLTVPDDLYSHLRFISQVDGLSVPVVITAMIANGIRARKASDPTIRDALGRRT